MDSTSNSTEVITQNTLVSPEQNTFNEIKKELIDDEIISRVDSFDDYDFEPFHENVFRTLSANFDNIKNIEQVNDAYGNLENCFVENNILSKEGFSKFNLKQIESTNLFVKYRDIDEAFVDMVISDSTIKLNDNTRFKKIDLRPFKETIFSVKLNGQYLDDESELRNCESESNSEGSEFVDIGSHSENEASNIETQIHEVSLNTTVTSAEITQTVQNEMIGPLKETIKDVRIVVEKLPEVKLSNQEEIFCFDQLISNDVKRQVARKKTGGVMIQRPIDHDNNGLSNEQKVINQLSSKDGEFVPNVFDKMTRAGKRDLERVLAESTANLVMKKTSQLISERIKEIQTQEESSESGTSDVDEPEEYDINKTAEIVTSTIMEILKKNKCKKLDKLGKDISEEITNRISSLKYCNDSSQKTSEQNSTPVPQIDLEKPTTVEDQGPETITVDKEPKINEENVEEEPTRRATRQSTRTALKKKTVKISENTEIDESAANKKDSVQDTEPRRPETRSSRYRNLQKSQSDLSVANILKTQLLRPRRKTVSNKVAKTKTNVVKQDPVLDDLQSTNTKDLLGNKDYIDGQFLIDSALIDDAGFSISDSELSEIASAASSRFLLESDELNDMLPIVTNNSILRANADSTTSEVGLLNSESILHGVNDCYKDLDSQSKSDVTTSQDIESAIRSDDSNKLVTSNEIISSNNDSLDIISSNEVGNSKELPGENGKSVMSESSSISGEHTIEKHLENCIAKDNAHVTSKNSTEMSGKELEEWVKKVAANEVENFCSKDHENLSTQLSKGDKEQSEDSPLKDKSDEKSTYRPMLGNWATTPLSSFQNIDSYIGSASSFLNYSMDDSFRLLIDEGPPIEEKNDKISDLNEIISNELNESKKIDNSTNDIVANINDEKEEKESLNEENKLNFVEETEIKQEENENKTDAAAIGQLDPGQQEEDDKQKVSAKLTNEEKIAQIIRRDPRLLNDKKEKVSNTVIRDPRLRNRIPKTEEVLPQPTVQPAPVQPALVQPPAPSSKTFDDVKKVQSVKTAQLVQPTDVDNSPLPDPQPTFSNVDEKNPKKVIEPVGDNAELSRKKKMKKDIDEELLYKTPLSDLHSSTGERSTYVRDKPKPIPLLSLKLKDSIEQLPRNRSTGDGKSGRLGYNKSNEDNKYTSRYFGKREPTYNERSRNFSNTYEEENRRTEGNFYGGSYEERNYHRRVEEREQHYQPPWRENYEEDIYSRRTREDKNYNNQIMGRTSDNFNSRIEFPNRNNFGQVNVNTNRYSRVEDNNYCSQQGNFAIETIVNKSAYPPVLLADPVFNNEEIYSRRYREVQPDFILPATSTSSDRIVTLPTIINRSPSPERIRVPTPPLISGISRRSASPDEPDYDGFSDCDEKFHRNYEKRKDDSSYRCKAPPSFAAKGSNRPTRGNDKHRRVSDRDYYRSDASPPRKRFARDDERTTSGSSRWKRSPSWSPDRRPWSSRERSMSPIPNHWDNSPPRRSHSWKRSTSPAPADECWDSSSSTSSPSRHHDNYRHDLEPYKPTYDFK